MEKLYELMRKVFSRTYTVEALPIDPNGAPVESNCADITFINYGTNTLIINNSIRVPAPATPGQFNSITIAGNMGEMDVTKYICIFDGAGTSNAIFIRRNYKKK